MIRWTLPLLALASLTARADDDVNDNNLDEVKIFGTQDSPATSRAVLDAGSPESLVSEGIIHQVVSPVGDYGSVANLTPSFVSSAPNGPGFDAAKNQTLRGFVDGQFNVTMDGIPFEDPDNFAHHSTSYFPTSQLDHLVIDRSPGQASDLGYASFGGSVNLYSVAIPENTRVRLFGDYGSFGTSLFGTTLNTAAPQSSGQVGVLASAERSQSSGALDNSAGYKDDFLVKVVSLLGPARLTGLYAYDYYQFYNPGSITTTDLALYGSSFGYNTVPSTPNYFRYSNTARASDFGYLKLELPFAEHWRLEDKVYTFSFRNSGLSLKGDQTSSPIGTGFTGFAPTDIAGRTTQEDYRTLGNDLRVTLQGQLGSVLLGVWTEHSWQTEWRDALDLTTGQFYDVNKADHSPVYFNFDSHLNSVQPYGELTWQITDDWRLRAGIRWRDVTRDFDASVIQNFLPGTPGTVSHRVTSTLPSADTTYRFNDHTSVYAQVSKGSLVPSQAFFYTANPAAGDQVNAETSLGEQLGIVYQTSRYGLALDAYHIHFDNFVSTITQNGDTLFVNAGAVTYRGIETEDHVALGEGLTLVANASLLRATFGEGGLTSSIQYAGATIPFAPTYTALAGLLYSHGPLGASLLTKFIGTEYQGKNGSADGATYRVGAYSYTNATVTGIINQQSLLRDLRVTLALNNIFNSDAITDNAGPSIEGPTLVNVLARRNLMLTVVADL